MKEGIDLTYLKSISNGDQTFELTMINSLMAEIDQKMEALRANLAAVDRDGIKLQAHSLKNLFAILGAESLRNACLQVETNVEITAMESLLSQAGWCEKEWSETRIMLASIVAVYENDLAA